jgi:molybdopterin-guanine dinucleotide biosynthesis protein A
MPEKINAENDSVSAVILAGGLGIRFGSYKPLFTVSGRTILEHLESRIEGLYGEIVVVAGTESQQRQLRKRLGQMNVITDQIAGIGPLGGILTGVRQTHHEYCQILPVDSPLPIRGVLQQLLASVRGFEGAVPMWKDGRLEPLHGVYKVDATAREAGRLIGKGCYSVVSLVRSLGNVCYVNIDELRALDPDLDTFANINTREDLKEIISKLNYKPH